ncbi:GNAT family N-acetyltransferase [Allopusillimonas ginsengisoli]|uniref:GNAT family N-acetyltransferase n=1 Tax=Allopusillimonas ginsengisoli TaxID=453575 RepID=UPI001020F807|nr:GNAT family N-acetyltransferase [Allopusillimonas ginsengisoli]TEA74215.1 GNAT family N-acetyltransferase [Allopusillimonas ginsengisoli]
MPQPDQNASKAKRSVASSAASALGFREARREDIPAIVALLADDALGANRDGPQLMTNYLSAWEAMAAQKGNALIVATLSEEVVGVLQLTLIPGLSRGGMLRGQIESVRVSSKHRGYRIGQQLLAHAIDIARSAGCGLVQLTSDKQRTDALRFYAQLGFVASHEGLKLTL